LFNTGNVVISLTVVSLISPKRYVNLDDWSDF